MATQSVIGSLQTLLDTVHRNIAALQRAILHPASREHRWLEGARSRPYADEGRCASRAR